ncbi:hypothetical protein Nepgr_005496 [Nepenthes gracilis]|uniref:Auxin-responsive protein n=1 Tax=Nepenthes gracilis TaxID=150966 RepID=A0AAD3XGH9_NEPGR|nr:hypothetical protein Nepgr_005496 [Nepenthes gracilis]
MAKMGVGLEITELRLGLPGGGSSCDGGEKKERKRVFSEINGGCNGSSAGGDRNMQAVGWPPVCSYRRKKTIGRGNDQAFRAYVKVSMDGVPFLRKIDIGSRDGYPALLAAFEELFGCFGIGEALEDADSSEYVPIYEDKDGDWMLVGDVPWKIFVESCKRLRIMKRPDTKLTNYNW